MPKMEDVMIILSEREANRILLSANFINRNPFVEQEQPKLLLQNRSWYEFTISQITKRWRIKKKLFKIIPDIFTDCESSFQIALTNLMFAEIKKKRAPKTSLKKEDYLLNLQTDFQELIFLHSKGCSSDKYA